MRALALGLFLAGCGGSGVSTAASAPAPAAVASVPVEWTPVRDHAAGLAVRAITPDGRFVVLTRELAVCLFDLEAESMRACGLATGDVTEVAVHPTEDRMALGTFEGAIELWDLATWRRVQTLQGHANNIDALSWAADGALLSGSWDGTLRSWEGEPRTGRILEHETREDGRPLWFRALARHGGRFAFAVGGDVHVRNDDGTVAVLHPTAAPTALSFSPSGDRLAIALYDGHVSIWDGRSADTSQRFRAYGDYMGDVAWLDDHRLVVSGRGGPARVVDTSGDVLQDLGIRRDAGAPGLVVSPRRDIVIADADDGIHRFEGSPMTDRLLRAEAAHGYTAAFHPTLPRLAMAVPGGALLLASPDTSTFAHFAAVDEGLLRPVAVGPDGRFAAGTPAGTVRVFDASGDLERELDLTGTFEAYGFGPARRTSARIDLRVADAPRQISWEGSRIAVGTGERVQILSADDGRREQVLVAPLDMGDIDAIALSVDGRRLAFGSDDGFVWVVDLDSRQLLASGTVHQSTISGIALSPDGRRVATVAQDGFLAVLDIASGETLLRAEHDSRFVLGVAWSPDGSRLATSCEGVVYLRDADDGAIVTRIEGHARTPWRLGFMGGGRYLASFGDDTIVVDVEDPSRRLLLRGFDDGGRRTATVLDHRGRFDVVGDPAHLIFRGPGDVRTAELRTAADLAERRDEGLAARFFHSR